MKKVLTQVLNQPKIALRMINDIKEQSLSEYLGSRIRTLMNDHADQVAGGGCKDFASYQRLCGVIEGLALAEREMLDWKEKFMKDQDSIPLYRAKYD